MQKTTAIFAPASALALTLALACILSGCTVGPKYHRPVVQPPPAFTAPPTPPEGSGKWTIAQPQDTAMRGDWWQIFNEPELNALEEQLNLNNQNIKVSFENLMEARALIGEARAQYFPTATATPSFSRSRSSGNLTHAATANTGSQTSTYALPLQVSWEPDLWGRVRNEVHEAQYAAQVSAADLANEKLSEQVNLAELYFQIRGQDALVKLYRDTVTADQQALAVVQASYDAGIDDFISVEEAKTTLQSAQSQAINLGILRAQYEHAIAVLVGKPAPGFSIPVRPLNAAPPPIPMAVPSQLLERRPDIAGAERVLAADNAALGIAYSAFYPTLTLSAAGGFQSSAFTRLLEWPSRFWSIGPSIAQPIFRAGLKATLHQYTATYNANLASYRQTVLTAFQQVEDSMTATQLLSAQIRQQQLTVASAQNSLNLEMTRYRSGIDPYLSVVTLQTTLLSSQQTLASLQTEAMTSAVQLVGALGGGWDTTQLPTPAQLSKTPPKADTKIQQ